MSEQYESSSSSDSENGVGQEYVSNIKLQNFNLRDHNKKQNSGAKKNLAKAGKRITSKSVRFPDSYTPRHTIISTSSNASSLNSSDVDSNDLEHSRALGMPSFGGIQEDHSDSRSEDDSEEHETNKEGENIPQFGHTFHASSDSELEEQEKSDYVPTGEHNESIGSKKEGNSSADTHSASVSSKDSKDFTSDSYSLNDPQSKGQNRHKSLLHTSDTVISEKSNKSNKSNEGSKWNGLKGILRRVSLSSQAQDHGGVLFDTEPSNSDTFLGKVINTSGGMSGGGLTPILNESGEDEEADIGGRESRELKNINFSELNSEAQKLISAHIPGLDRSAASSYADLSRVSSTTNNEHEDQQGDDAGTSSAKEKHAFYAPNPELYLRDQIDDMGYEDDYLMLDNEDGSAILPPKKVQAGVLSSLLKLYQNPLEEKSSSTFQSGLTFSTNTIVEDENENDDYEDENMRLYHSATSDLSRVTNGLRRGGRAAFEMLPTGKLNLHFKKDKDKIEDDDGYDLSQFPSRSSLKDSHFLPSFQNARPKFPKKGPDLAERVKRKKFKNHEKKLRITVHIADILQRQRFILRMCRALMLFGAPTHRLEEYMVMTSRVLELDGQFVYFPGCMIVSFGDASTRTSEVHLVRCAQGLNLSKLSDTHKIYKSVIHDLSGVEEASADLEKLLKQKNLYSRWLCVLFYGFGSAMVAPFAFNGGWRDLPISFGVGLCVGYLQFFLSSKSNLYSSVFEVAASIVVSFIGRAIGSINSGGTFCFSAITQGSLALILPGYIILCGSLELQSRNLVAGSVRMFYAIIYSLFLGFGITLGAALYGWIDKNSTSEEKCLSQYKIDDRFRILFVPGFSIALGLINQARISQLPIMVFISCAGYVATYFAGKHFSSVTEFNAAIGAFVVGVLGNLYSRLWKGMAVSAMLPAIFVQVPSGIASQGTLISGVNTANQITHSNSTSESTTTSQISSLGFGVTMVQVSIGISVGLFAAAIVVYPFGKRKTGIFTL